MVGVGPTATMEVLDTSPTRESHAVMPFSTTGGLSRPLLTEMFATVADPRDPRGIRHRLTTILAIAQAAVLGGAQSLLEIDEWAADADRHALARFGVRPEEVLPSESTLRRTLAALDGDELDTKIAAWMAIRTGELEGRQVIAVDGKSLRGAGRHGQTMPHLLAALDHDTGVVAGQRAVETKTNEIPALPELLAEFDLNQTIVTADALHCQRETAAYITGRGGHYTLCVKENQPTLRRQLKTLPWKDIRSTTAVSKGHGRRVRRTVRAIQAPDWVDFPGAAQVVQLRRTRTIKGSKSTEVVYLICSVPMAEAPSTTVAAWVQGHWSIENRLHWVRDVVFDEDRHQLRTGNGPQVMASLRNTAISLLRQAGYTCIAKALRHHGRNSRRPIELILTA